MLMSPILDRPKSVSLMWPREVISRLWGQKWQWVAPPQAGGRNLPALTTPPACRSQPGMYGALCPRGTGVDVLGTPLPPPHREPGGLRSRDINQSCVGTCCVPLMWLPHVC